MVKKQLRKEYAEKRKSLSVEEQIELDAQIVNQFRSLDLQGIQQLLSYYPIPERKEFNMNVCEQLLILENPGLKVSWPKLSGDGVTMDAVPVNADTPMIKNSYGIDEPESGIFLLPQIIDAVFVPMLAFDTRGYRVGYGKGFYDRFLTRCAQDIVKIGFSYFDAVELISDINEFDVPLTYCITPQRVYEF